MAKRRLLYTLGLALLLSVIGLLARGLIDPWLGSSAPLLLLVLPVILSAWFGGVLPGLLATLVGGAGGFYFFLRQIVLEATTATPQVVQMLIFCAVGGLLSWLIGSRTTALRRESKALSDEFKASQRHAKELQDLRTALNASTIVAITDARGKITDVNEKFVQISGYAREELLGQDHRIINSGYHPKEFFRNLWSTIGKGRIWHGEIRNRAKDGHYYWVDTTIVPFLRAENNRPYQYVALRNDITERKRAEGRINELLDGERAARSDAERANRLKDEFLATLSHELRTPLNAILGWSQVLRRKLSAPEKPPPEQTAEGLQVIERNAQLQARLIEDLLDMSRIVSGKIRLDHQDVAIASIVDSAAESIRPTVAAKRIELETQIQSPNILVRGDPSRLHQVLWNLLTNAVKFTPEGGTVTVISHALDHTAEIKVVDTGQGIPPEFLPHMFERFRQADSSSTRRHGGLGLGLAIVRNLVELHGGTISVESRGLGQGAQFTVRLPLAASAADLSETCMDESQAAGVAFEESCNHLGGVRVLVVDDEQDARTLVQRVLEDCKAEVLVAASAKEGLHILKQQHLDVIVSDISMPEQDGYEFIKLIRTLEPEGGGRIPAAALTAFNRPEDRSRALQAGYQVHLAKPVEPRDLISVVASLSKGSGVELEG